MTLFRLLGHLLCIPFLLALAMFLGAVQGALDAATRALTLWADAITQARHDNETERDDETRTAACGADE